jgi:hypothetical protein
MNSNRKEETYWQKHKASWEASGLSQRGYSKREGLCNRKFNYHLKRLSKVPAEVGWRFIEVPGSILEKKPENVRGSPVKVELPNGVSLVLELSAVLTLAQVIEVVGAMRC